MSTPFDPSKNDNLQSGRWYRFPPLASVNTTVTLGNGNARAQRYTPPNSCVLQRLGAEVTVVGDAGSKLRLMVFNDDGTGRPGNLLSDCGVMAADVATLTDTGPISVPLIGGVQYWFSLAVQLVTVTQPTVRTSGAPNLNQNIDYMGAPSAGQLAAGYQMTGVTGAAPSVFIPSSTTGLLMALHGQIA